MGHLQLVDLPYVIKKHWRVAVVMLAIVVVASIAYALLVPKEYETTARLSVQYAQSFSADDSDKQYSALSYVNSRMNSLMSLGTDDDLLDLAAQDLNHTIDGDNLKRTVKVSSPNKTQFIDVSATAKDPDTAARKANAVAEVLSEDGPRRLSKQGETPLLVVAVEQKAEPSRSSSTPNVKKIIFMGVFAAVAIALLSSIAKELWSQRSTSF